MTVRQLAEILHTMDPDAEVGVYSELDEGGGFVGGVEQFSNYEAACNRYYFKGDSWDRLAPFEGKDNSKPLVVISGG